MPVTVECPLCGKPVQIPGYNAITRTDALVGHIATEHASQLLPTTPLGGPPLPRGLEYSLAMEEVLILLREADKPKSLGEKIAEYLSRPPQPVLRFYGDFATEVADSKRHLLFAVRNGLPLPLFYGLYIKANAEYIEKTDHIGPFSTDDWRLTLDTAGPAQVEIRVGILPFELLTDKAQIAV